MSSNNNFQIARAAIGASKWRSFLTMLGVIVGVLSVVTIVSLGEGVKKQLTNQIKHTGADLITVRGGQIANRDSSGKIKKVNYLNFFAGANLSDADYLTVQKIPELSVVAPFAVVPGVPKAYDGTVSTNTSVVATNSLGAVALKQDIAYGEIFDEKANANPGAVIGKNVAEQLFKENVPIGKSFELRGQKIVVRGVFQEFEASPLTPGVDYNNAIFIPYEFAKKLAGGSLQPYQILVRPKDDSKISQSVRAISSALTASHGGEADFTVLQASDNIEVADSVLNVITSLVSAIAGISLFVGGIGIMNIMFVAVSERTHEIGIRKSVGATNKQILNQFLVESIVLSGTGGLMGVIASLFVNYLIRIFTPLQPVITLPIMGIAIFVALAVGVFFGITPALKAARKDPIESLRRN